MKRLGLVFLMLSVLGCSEAPMEPPPPDPTLETDAVVRYSVVYQSGALSLPGFGPRDWIPTDVTASPMGELWVVQRMVRDPSFDDDTECVAAAQRGAANDCTGLTGSTVGLRDPRAAEAATEDNGRANLVVDANSWHFMRRPSAIAFGATEVRIEPDDPGAMDSTTMTSILTEAAVYTNTFATCHEHRTGNFTDQAAFIGPTLWTADPAIYNGVNGDYDWSNGSHLDMLHATSYCMGIAHDSASVYWTFNGELGTLDRYDFGAPHVVGHYYHDDGLITRFELGADALARLPDVPSNMMVSGDHLYIADTGNGRVVRFARNATPTQMGTFLSHEGIRGDVMGEMPLEVIASIEELSAIWGARVEPSGLAFVGSTLVVANHGTGHIALFDADGQLLRNLDTGLGEGIGGLTVMDGAIYFAHMRERRVYRIDVDTTMREGATTE
jgi:hypothetical protein